MMKNKHSSEIMPGNLDEFFDVVSALVSWRTLIKENAEILKELEESGRLSEESHNYYAGKQSVLEEHLRVELGFAHYVHQRIMMPIEED